MSNSVLKKWTNAVRHLNEKIKNNRLIAGRNIQLENTGNGIRIHCSASGGTVDDTYKGGFKVVKDGENLKVILGKAPAYAHCGGLILGHSSLHVPVVTFPITAAVHYITLRLVYNTASRVYQAEIVITDNHTADYPPPNNDPYLFWVLATYSEETLRQYYKVLDDGYATDLNGKYWV
jgi:hypothetical protein